MDIHEFQKKCAATVGLIDEKFAIERDSQLSLCQLMEEIGELIREIDKPRLRNKAVDIDNLKGEFADVILQLFALTEKYNINVEEAVIDKVKELQKRGYLD